MGENSRNVYSELVLGSVVGLVVVLLASVLLLGYVEYRVVTSVRVKELRIVDLNLIGATLNPRELELIMELRFENPSPYLLGASRVSLTLYVAGYFVGHFSVGDIKIPPGESFVRLPLRAPTTNVAPEAFRAWREGGVTEVRVFVTVELPVVIFGINTPLTHSMKYDVIIRWVRV